jgi:hypothetical protein
MHECMCTLIQQHLDVRLVLPAGTKTRKTDSESVGKYRGSLKFSELENWLTNLVILLEVKQYGGHDHD